MEKTLEQLSEDLLTATKTIAEKEAALATANKTVEDKYAEIEMLNEKVAGLEKKLAEKEAEAPSKESFELDGKTYEIVVGRTIIPSVGLRTALEIANDKELQAILVQRNSGSIREKK